MKLHLPNGLRKALLACLAALALPAALPTTLATASGIAAAWVMASQQAKAENVTITSKDEYNTALAEKNAAGNTWTFDIGTGSFNFGKDDNKGPTHAANFTFNQTLTVNQGYNGATNTFNGNFTGGEGANLVFAGWGADNVTNTWQFNGNLSGFKGGILVTGRTLNVVFGAGAQTNAGAIRQDGGTLNLTLNGQNVSNSEIRVNNLTLNGAVGVGVEVVEGDAPNTSVTALGTTTFGGEAALTLRMRSSMTLGNVAETSSALKALSLGDGAELTTSSGSLRIDEGVSVTLGSGARANLGGTTTFGDGVTLTLGNGATMILARAETSSALRALSLGDNAALTTGSGSLRIGEGVSVTLGSGAHANLGGTTTFGDGATLALGRGAQLTLHEIAADSGRLAALELYGTLNETPDDEKTVLTLEKGVLKVKDMTIVSGTATIVVGNYKEGSTDPAIGSDAVSLDLSGVLGGEGKLIIDITGLGLKSGGSFQLFTGARLDWTSLERRVSFKGFGDANWRVDMGEDGKITLRSIKNAYFYDGIEGLEWGVSGDGGWRDGQEWDNNSGRDANFTATEGTHLVSLAERELYVGVMDVAVGTAVYNISNGSVSNSATLSVGTLTVGEGVTMNFAVGTQLHIGSYLSLGKDAVLAIGENMKFDRLAFFRGGSGSKIVRAEGVTDPVYLELYLGGDTRKTINGYLEDVLRGITIEDVGISKHGSDTLAFTHNLELGYTEGPDTFDVPLEIAEGAVQLNGSTFILNKQVTGSGKLIIATESDDEEVMVHLVGGANMTGTLEFSNQGARLGLGADSIVSGLNTGGGGEQRSRVIVGEKEDGNVRLTINANKDASLIHVEISGVDIVKRGTGTQNLSMHFSGGSITVEEGTLSTINGYHWSTLDATSVFIAEGATFHWEDATPATEDYPVHGTVSGEVDIQGTFKVGDPIDLMQGATIGENGNIITRWATHVRLGGDLLISHADALKKESGYGNGTLEKSDSEGAAEHVHLQLSGGGQDYVIVGGVWGSENNAINVDSSLGLHWKGDSGQLRVEGSELDEVLVAGSGKLWFQSKVTLNGELKFADDYVGGADVYVHNDEGSKLTLKVGGTLKSVLNGGWGTYISLGADFEVGGLQIKDAGSGSLDVGLGSPFEIERYIDAPEDTVSLILNVASDVTLNNTLTLGEGVNLEKTGLRTQTITGTVVAWGDVMVRTGTLALGGKGSEIKGALSGEGTLKVDAGGELTLSGGGDFIGTLELGPSDADTLGGGIDAAAITVEGKDLSVSTLSGQGSVTVTRGTLTLGTAEGATLTGLTLGQPDTGDVANLTVNTGSFTISGAWTWTEGSVLRLVTAGQTITLGDITEIEGNGQLTIDLTEAFLGEGSTGRVQLFASGFKGEWTDYFRFTVNGEDVGAKNYTGPYKGLKLNSKGVLRWGAGDVYWIVDQAGEALTWSGETTFETKGDGYGEPTEWTDDTNVSFVVTNDGAGEHDVILQESIQTGNFSISTDVIAEFHIGTPDSEKDPSRKEARTLTVNGDLDITRAQLSLSKEVQLVVEGDVALTNGGTLTLNSDMRFAGDLVGDAGSVVKGAGNGGGMVYALWDSGSTDNTTWEAFSGRYAAGVCSGDVGYGVYMSEEGLTITGAAPVVGKFKVDGVGKTLTFSETLTPAEGAEVTVAGGATLALEGGIAGGGSITGAGTLKITGVEGETEPPSEQPIPVFTGSISVKELIIEGGAQAFGKRDDDKSVVQGTIKVTGGVLQLNEGANLSSAAVVLAPENTGEAAELLRVVGSAEVSTLSGTGKVKVDEGATLTLSGVAGEEEVFTGQITGATAVTGTWQLGSGASLEHLTVGDSGTVNVREGEATVQQLDGSGTLAGAGTLKLTAESGTFGGRVLSSLFIYCGGGTFELSGAIDSPDVRVESGTLKVSGEVASAGGAIPAMTLAGGTLDAARNGLTIRKLILVGATSGLKVTNNLTVGEVTGDGVLGTSVIGTNASLTVRTGNLTIGVLNGDGSARGSLDIGSGAELTMQSGTLTLNGLLTWGKGAELSLGGDHERNRLVFGTDAPFGRRDGKLTVFLEERYLRGMKKSEDSFFDLDVSKWKAGWVNEMEVTTDSKRYTELKLNEDGTLTWTRYGVQWNAGASGTWSDDPSDPSDPSEGWTKVDSNEPSGEAPKDQDVYFIEEGETTVQVEIADAKDAAPGSGVHPKNVYVESGNFEFTGGGISTDGILAVGGDPKGKTRLTLSNVNISLPVIELQENGYLVLNNDRALTSPSEENGGAADTKIRFTGGTLEFGELLKDPDVSSHVATAEDGSTEAAKVNVGKDKEVRWGSAETEVTGNGGLTLILDQTGLEKGGEGNFILAWKETEEGAPHAHVGNMVVQGGTLTLRAEDGVSELRGTAEVENGTLTLQSADTAGLTYAGNITGAGTLNVSQGNVTLSGENTVADIELTGGNTTLGSDSALGNADTVLTLTGGSVTGVTGSTSTVNAGTVSVVGAPTVNGAVTFSGTVIGEGTLRAGTGAAVTLTGSLSRKDETGEVTQQFLGTLDTGAGTITLNNSDTEVRASVAGNGTLEVKPAVDPSTGKPADVTLAGTLGASDGNLTVKNGGESDLLITSQNCGGGLNLSFNEPVEGDDPAVGGDTPEESEPRIPRIVLGDAEHAVNVAELRSVTGAGDVVLSNVTLDMASDFRKETARMFVDTAVPAQNASDVRAVDAAPAGGEVFLGGMDAANLDGITVNAHGLLSGVSGTYQVSPDKQLTLYFSADNMGREEERGKLQGLINGNDDFNIAFSAGDAKTQGFNLEFDRSALLAALRAGGENNALYLRALQGGKWNAAEVGVTLSAQDELADILGARYEFTDDGLMIWGSTKDLYIVMDGDESDPAVSRDPDVLGRRLATVVTAGQTLTLDWGKDGTVHNLLGGDNATLNINDTSGSGLTVTLDNTYHEDIRDGRDQYTEAARGQDTTFEGTITGGKGVDIVKTGLGTLTVNGNYTLEDGDTRIEAGALHLCGDNSMRSLTFAYGEPSTESRGLTLETGHTSIGSIAEATTTEGNAVKLTKNAELTLTGGGTLARTSVTSDGSGKLRLKDNASLVFTGGGITDTKVELGSGTVLDLGASQSQLTALDGSGTLKSAEGGVVTVGGGKFSGTLGSSAEGGKVGGLVVADGALFTLDNAKSESGVKMNVQVGKEASLTVDVSGKTGSASDTLVLGDISIGDGGSLTLDFGGKDISRDFVQGNITSVGTDGSIVFNRDDELKSGVYYTGLTVADVTMKDYVQFTGFGNFLKDITSDVQDGELVLRVTDARQNKFTEPLRHVAQGSEKNAQAGSVILWNAFLAHPDVGNKPGSDLAALASTLVNSVNAGKSAGLARTLTAAAGAAISTLGPALAEDMHRQLTAIRNRTTTMANEVRNGADGQYPLRHAWINAESGYHELDSDGLAPGYKLTGWGGTVGADVDISRHLTAGLAFTAMYGDLDADAADSATGDMDTYYLSAFARVASGSWIHSFVLSGGVADVELNRTVNYGGLSPYRTNGSTDGYALGALYEVGYTGFVNRQGTAALQPIFNVEVRHVAIKGYSESGSDAGVDADDIDQTVLTFGAGARAQFAVGANVFNRAAVLETRALLKADVGDRSGTVSNAIVGNTARAEVESAEVGAVGVEAGVGISVPLGSNAGSVFLDGSLEFREGWTSANASLGYRINF